ncbi:hypothetical protein STEG23_013806 [Scotinomys teguina]
MARGYPKPEARLGHTVTSMRPLHRRMLARGAFKTLLQESPNSPCQTILNCQYGKLKLNDDVICLRLHSRKEAQPQAKLVSVDSGAAAVSPAAVVDSERTHMCNTVSGDYVNIDTAL